jgi:Protein of unknown function (DUF2384)
MDNSVRSSDSGVEKKATVGNFSSSVERTRLSKTALKAFLNICDRWMASGEVALELSGLDVDEWQMVKSSDFEITLNQDQLTRISALVGIFKGLNLLFVDSFANDWPNTKNTGPLFGGQTPIELMLTGGIPMMLKVRSHVDALRGGI